MNRPWQVLADVKELVDRVGWQDFQVQLFEILEADDPGAVWVSSSMDSVDAVETLGLEWDIIRDIFEEELAEEIRNHTARNDE